MKNIFIFILMGLSIISCTDNNDNTNACDLKVIIDSELYANTTNQPFINSVEIIDNCLKINFSAGGCSGDTWELKLIDSGAIAESYPPQRNLRLSLKNEELCNAMITKELTFDISNLQVSGNQVYLNIDHLENGILYEH